MSQTRSSGVIFILNARFCWHESCAIFAAISVDFRSYLTLFDELYASAAYYWNDTWLIGRPRTVSLSLDYRFF